MYPFPKEDISLDDDGPAGRSFGGPRLLAALDIEQPVFDADPDDPDPEPPAPTAPVAPLQAPLIAQIFQVTTVLEPDPSIDLGREEESLFARDENDALVRREKEVQERFKDIVTVVIDGYPVEVPRARPKIDAQGNPVRGPDGFEIPRTTTIYDAAARLVELGQWTEDELKSRIPALCHQPHVTPVAVCRMCSVHISSVKRGKLTAGRKLVPACQHRVETNMVVTTRAGLGGYNPGAALGEDHRRAVGRAAADVAGSVRLLAELYVADCFREPLTAARRYDDELAAVARSLGILSGPPGEERVEVRPALVRRPERPSRNDGPAAVPQSRRIPLDLLPTVEPDELAEEPAATRDAWAAWNERIDREYPYSSRTVVVDHDRCIVCDRCVRACAEVRPFKVIGHTGRGHGTRISFDLDALMGQSCCVKCGECMNACPTGALSLRRRVRPRAWEDSPEHVSSDPNSPFPASSGFLTADEMREVWLLYESPTRGPEVVFPFRSVPYSFLKWNEGAVRRHEIWPGERRRLCTEGTYASTAFLLQGTGTFEAYVRGPRPPERRPGFFASLFGRSEPAAAPADPGVRVATFSGTELILGEMSCLSHRPWTATVVAVAPADNPALALSYDENGWPTAAADRDRPGPMVVYEVTRNVLDVMRRSAAFREQVQEVYALRAVQAGVSRGRIFERLDPMERKQAVTFLLARGVQYSRVEAGGVIVEEGDVASAFYVIYRGTARVSTAAGGEQVLRLLSAGDSFGEAELLSDRPGRRSATVAALDPVELVRVPGPVFRELCEKFPKVAEALGMARPPAVLGGDRVPPTVLRDYVRQGLYQAQNLLAIDLKSCTRCGECTKACADSHADGQSRLLLDGLRFGDFLVATSCRSCHKPYCMDGCPVDAIHRRGSRLEVVIENHCIGCGLCETSCPYGAIHMVARGTPNVAAASYAGGDPHQVAARRAVNCDLCDGGEPLCVYACPHEAAVRTTGAGLLQSVLERPGH